MVNLDIVQEFSLFLGRVEMRLDRKECEFERNRDHYRMDVFLLLGYRCIFFYRVAVERR